MGKRTRANGEGSVYQRKEDKKWVASITLENGKRKVFYGDTKKEAREKLQKALQEQQQGMLVAAPQQTVEQFLNQWLESRKHAVRIRTHERYEEYIRLHIVPVIGRVQLQKLTAQNVQALYTKKLGEGLSPTTVATMHGMLHKALVDAVKWELVAKNVCDLIEPPRRAHHEINTLTVEQARTFMTAVKGHSMEALFVLAITTGMRRGEVLALKWQDINFSQSTLQVQRIFTRAPGNRYIEAEPKTAKSRRNIVLAPVKVNALLQHRIRQLEAKQKASSTWQENDLVFCTSLGTPLNPNKVLERFKTLLMRAGLPHIRFHDLRHSAATLLLSMGVHPKIVQELLGHNQISMTMDTYSHVLPTMQTDAMSKLNEALMQLKDEGDEESNKGEDDGYGTSVAGVPRKPKKG